MSDAQRFIVTKPAGTPLVNASQVLEALTEDRPLGIGMVWVEEAPSTPPVEPTTLLPFRLVRGDETIAAFATVQQVADVFVTMDLSEDISMHHTLKVI